MFSEDYLLRIIRQATAVFARVIGLKSAGQYPDALQGIDQALEIILGMDAEIIRLLDDESLYKILTNNEGLDLDKLEFIADLFKEEGDIQKLQDHNNESINGYKRALDHYLVISNTLETSIPTELSQKIDELLQKIDAENFDEKTLLNLFCYHENAGEFAKAELMLNRLAARNDPMTNAVDEMKSFYQRLMEKDSNELAAGGMSRTKIQNKLKELE
jgi:tetratricopeptide (TPR) repeat protein